MAAVAYESVSSKSQLKQGSTKVVVTKACRLQVVARRALTVFLLLLHTNSFMNSPVKTTVVLIGSKYGVDILPQDS